MESFDDTSQRKYSNKPKSAYKNLKRRRDSSEEERKHYQDKSPRMGDYGGENGPSGYEIDEAIQLIQINDEGK